MCAQSGSTFLYDSTEILIAFTKSPSDGHRTTADPNLRLHITNMIFCEHSILSGPFPPCCCLAFVYQS